MSESDLGRLEEQLHRYFGYSAFRTGQQQIIEDILAGQDVFGILPTGTGKSVCYQLPAKLIPGLTIVVTPLVSLMLDQVKELQAIRYKGAAALNSFVSPLERKRIFRDIHMYDLIYVSPELLQQKEVLAALKRTEISLFVIDEAHCISQWGHEFRPDYLKLGDILESLGSPQVLALSATAAPFVREDIRRILKRSGLLERIYPMDRENIALSIQPAQDEEDKLSVIMKWLQKDPGPSLIYFSSRIASEETAQRLIARLPDKRIAFYHGGMDQMDRVLVQQQFMNGQLDIICCTSAFGMGINKKDIRLVIHYHFPPNLESFIQEIGRAGRDGGNSISLLLYNEQDLFLTKRLLENELPGEGALHAIFQILGGLVSSGRTQIGQGPEYQNLFQVNETQWRFLYYQFEKHGIIKDNQLVYEEAVWKGAFQEIQRHIKHRMAYKETKLSEMAAWMMETGCLREALYRHFQEGFKVPEINCCISCGLDESLYENQGAEMHHDRHAASWKDKLQAIFFCGGVQ